ncbi:threonine transporter RhtB [Paenibacillus antarcticus]|uniref:Threonine transporter RhtB n=2 Tax=Paenibacillus antarcticus TaxID=253703 RepID=A0A168JYU8_9BACL|nr:LysE family translocator [Paenibacillus antarcticus]OAB41286.1 threonine transporter RhtB [Paenibacillus antarcticus]
MFTLSSFLLFIGTSIVLILIPGPDLIFAITQGMTNGRKAGFYTAIGLSLGNIVHTLAAALGLSIIITTSVTAFSIFKWAGALYLFYLSYKAIKYRKNPIQINVAEPKSQRSLLLKGLTMNILNPKVAIFFLTFLPQFVQYKHGYVPLQMIILGLIFLILSGIIFALLAYFAGTFSQRLLEKPKFAEYANVTAAIIYIGLGLKLLTTQP